MLLGWVVWARVQASKTASYRAHLPVCLATYSVISTVWHIQLIIVGFLHSVLVHTTRPGPDRLPTQVDEMEKAVDVAEKNMARFGLDTAEIRSRRSWVHDTRRTVSALGADVTVWLVRRLMSRRHPFSLSRTTRA